MEARVIRLSREERLPPRVIAERLGLTRSALRSVLVRLRAEGKLP